MEKKSGIRLFDDALIDDGDDSFNANDQPKTIDKKSAVGREPTELP